VRDFVVADARDLIELHRQKLGRKRVRRERWQQRRLKGFSKIDGGRPLR